MSYRYRIAFQWDETRSSWFFNTNRGILRITQALFSVLLIGIIFLLFEVGSWTWKSASLQWQSYTNRSLQQDLALLIKRQSHVETYLDNLHQSTSRISALYGMGQENKNLRLFGIGGRRSSSEFFAETNFSLYEQLSRAQQADGRLKSRYEFSTENLEHLLEYVKYKHKLWEHTPSIQPARGEYTSLFGLRTHPVTGGTVFHEGLDIANAHWTPVYASASGLVSTSRVVGSFGRLVVIDHGNGYITKYGHLSKVLVHESELIKRGGLIGYMGSSGRTTGPHLHYEVHRDGKAINPSQYILPSTSLID